MKKITLLLTMSALMCAVTLQAQVAINQDGSDANSNSVLDVKDASNNPAFYIEAATGNVAVHNTTPAAADVFSSYATGSNWAINGYSVNAPAVYGETSGTGNAISGNSTGGAGVFGTSGSSIGVVGIVNNSGSFGILAGNDNNDGTGLIGIGNNSSPFNYLVGGSGGAFTADTIGVVAWGTHSNRGTGVVGVGNNISNPSILTSGSGGAFTGYQTGIVGFATSPGWNAYGGYFSCGTTYAYVGGWQGWPYYTARKIIGTGSVSTIVKDVEGELITLTCPEAPEILFQDFGIGKLNNGKVHISIDPNLTKNINVDETHPLKVFITLEGDCNGVYVTNKTAEGFDVIELKGGSSNVQFSWQIVATRANEEFILKNGELRVSDNSQRFQPAPDPRKLKAKKTKNFEERRINKSKKTEN